MKNTTYLLVIASIFIGCQQERSNKKAADSTITAETAVMAAAESRTCYVRFKDQDSTYLNLMKKGETVTGTLDVRLHEKDRNSGTVAGLVKGDTLLLEYTFQSEGVQSVRQLAYLQHDGKLIEGFADVQEKNGKTSFKSLKDLIFGGSVVLEQSDCK